MNEASTAANAMQEVATSSVIMTGDKTSMEYKILRIPRYVALFIICGFTVAIGILCMYNEDFSVTRSTLTYFGVPYFVGLVYYLLKMLRRVRSVQKRRHL